MDCASTHKKLADYLNGALPEDERQTIQAHLATCATCRAEWALRIEIDEAMATWPVFAEPEGLAARVMAEIEAHSSPALASRVMAAIEASGSPALAPRVRLRWQDALLGLALAFTAVVLVVSLRAAWTAGAIESMALDLQVQHSLSTIERALARTWYATRAEIRRDWVDVARVFGWVSGGIVLLAGAAATIVLVVQWPGEILTPFWHHRRSERISCNR